MTRSGDLLCIIAAAVLIPLCQAALADAPEAETKKIEALIAHVEGLKDARFVRNGVEYEAKTAGAFLRGKWEANKDKIKSAQDFIEQVATKSSTTGKLYLIRLKDGAEHKSGEYLTEQLMMLK